MIAIVDDDESMRDALAGLMRAVGWRAKHFASAEEFLKSPECTRAACLVADVNMPGMSGPDLHRHLVASGNGIPTILMTAYPNDKVRTRALSAGVLGYLTKPFVEEELLSHIRTALSQNAGEETSP